MNAGPGHETFADPFGAFVSRVPKPERTSGPLADLRLAVKDNIAVKGQPFTAGIPLYAERIATETAPAVQRFIDAGASFVGMTRTDAGGFGVTTPSVENPVLPGHSVGGSSGGNAAALAAEFADIALGTDTGGSVRIPAACCGLIGYKPSFGAVPRDGVSLVTRSFDTVGLMGRGMAALVRGAAILLDHPINAAPHATLRIGFDRQRLDVCQPAVASAVERALSALKNHGMSLQAVTLPDRERVVAAHSIVVLAEAHELYAKVWNRSPQLFPETVRRALAAAQLIGKAAIDNAQTEIDAMRREFTDACSALDAIVTPTLPVLPPPQGAHRVELLGRQVSVISALVAETALANITGGPAVSIPCTRASEGLVSLQALARQGCDVGLLTAAIRIEAAIHPPPQA